MIKVNLIIVTIQKTHYFMIKQLNKKVIGKFKDEACGVPIAEFTGLR